VYKLITEFIQKTFYVDAHHFLSGGFWLTINQIVVALSGIASTALFAHLLSAQNYGVYRYLIGLSLLFSIFSLTGLSQAILQTTSKGYPRFYQDTLFLQFKSGLGITLIAAIGSLYYYLQNNYILATGCVLISLLQPLINTYQNITLWLQAQKQFKKSSLINVVKTIFTVTVSIISVLITKDVVILILSYLLSQAISHIFIHYTFCTKPEQTFQPKLNGQYLNYAKHTSIQNIISAVAYRIDSILVFTMLGGAELAVYTIAIIIPEQIKGSFKNFSSLLLQKYSSTSNFDVIRSSIKKRSFQFGIILAAITITYIISSPYIISLLFPKYSESVVYSQWFSLAFLSYVYLIPLSLIQATTKKKLLYDFHTIPSVIQIILAPILILFFGFAGAVALKIIIQGVRMFLAYYLVFTNDL
jgi:O-antigen/teichoic acid export membrane protein